MARADTAADVIVAGGGAAGLACALAAARAGAQVAVLEGDVACARKVLATGNGRCNLTNESLDPGRYRYPAFAAAVLGNALRSGSPAFGRALAWLRRQRAVGCTRARNAPSPCATP